MNTNQLAAMGERSQGHQPIQPGDMDSEQARHLEEVIRQTATANHSALMAKIQGRK